jgi:hypothetical protein
MSSYSVLDFYYKSPNNSNNSLHCTAHTSALTSNQKYISPDSEVYTQIITPMRLYPGQTEFLPPPINNCLSPESIKAWDNNQCIFHKHRNPSKKHGGCNTCS